MTSSIFQWLSAIEFTAGGLVLYLISFLMLVIPFTIFGLETLSRKLAKRKLPKPTIVSELRIYPIKSCRGIRIDKTKLLRTGLDLDRRWMFVDAENQKFLTIRQRSEMTLIDTAITADDELRVSIRGKSPSFCFKIPAHPSKDWLEKNTELRTVEIWGHKTDGYVYPAELTAPLRELFQMDIRLVYKGSELRVLNSNGAPKHLGRIESTLFADLMPILISNQRSIELNSQLEAKGEDPITIERFRPNIIFDGDTPWYEDSWKTVQVGEPKDEEQAPVVMDVVQRCARCQVPNVDPETAVKHKKEPWDTLMKYRRIDEGIKFKPCFGMLCAPRSEAEIHVGMTLEVTAVTDSHRYLPGM